MTMKHNIRMSARNIIYGYAVGSDPSDARILTVLKANTGLGKVEPALRSEYARAIVEAQQAAKYALALLREGSRVNVRRALDFAKQEAVAALRVHNLMVKLGVDHGR